ncbi:hypothetical protein MSHRCOH1_04305 [Candidatus Ornithobacterium hominis]|nr:hypothetical protein MSHRCOH1_04305 [Candidatus Ornithobacterium hominis]
MSKKKNYWTEPKIKKYPLINPDGTNGMYGLDLMEEIHTDSL